MIKKCKQSLIDFEVELNANKDKLYSLPRRLFSQEMVENEEMWIHVSKTLLGFVLYKFPSWCSLSLGCSWCETVETPSSKQISKHLELSELRAEPQVVHLVNAGVTCVIHYLYDFTLNYPFSEVLLS